jgi:hypothetical protein
MPVQNIVAAATLTQDPEILGDDPQSNDHRRALALIKTVVVLKKNYP